jgi:hypothetical protein
VVPAQAAILVMLMEMLVMTLTLRMPLSRTVTPMTMLGDPSFRVFPLSANDIYPIFTSIVVLWLYKK